MNTTLTNDLCNEVRDLREQLVAVREQLNAANIQLAKGAVLLMDVLDAGRPHSTACDCDRCCVYEAVRKELRGE